MPGHDASGEIHGTDPESFREHVVAHFQGSTLLERGEAHAQHSQRETYRMAPVVHSMENVGINYYINRIQLTSGSNWLRILLARCRPAPVMFLRFTWKGIWKIFPLLERSRRVEPSEYRRRCENTRITDPSFSKKRYDLRMPQNLMRTETTPSRAQF